MNQKLTHRIVFDLGHDPGEFVLYPGGNAFYFDEGMESAISSAGIPHDPDELEDLFWPWIKPDIRRAIQSFKNRSSRQTEPLTDREKDHINKIVHPFDKRRTHYLKFGNMDQGPVEIMPAVLFKDHIHRCRDEIEQYFMRQESLLKAHELKSYVFSVFDLQSFFSGMLAKKMPQALNQEKVDTHFLKELCRLNASVFNKRTRLDPYLIRYVVMFFDHPYDRTKLLDDLSQEFIYRHSFHTPPKFLPNIPLRNALKIFNITKKELNTMTKKHLARLYRKRSRHVHPDTGGSHDNFIKLNNAYDRLLEKFNPH